MDTEVLLYLYYPGGIIWAFSLSNQTQLFFHSLLLFSFMFPFGASPAGHINSVRRIKSFLTQHWQALSLFTLFTLGGLSHSTREIYQPEKWVPPWRSSTEQKRRVCLLRRAANSLCEGCNVESSDKSKA